METAILTTSDARIKIDVEPFSILGTVVVAAKGCSGAVLSFLEMAVASLGQLGDRGLHG